MPRLKKAIAPCLRDECIDREIILSVAEARVLAEDYRNHYNNERPYEEVLKTELPITPSGNLILYHQ